MRPIGRYLLQAVPLLLLGVVILLFVTTTDTSQILGLAPGSSQSQDAWKALRDILLVLASGIITLTSAFLGGMIQSTLTREKEKRDLRHSRAQQYRDYLEWLLKLGQHAELVDNNPELRKKLPNSGKQFKITPEIRQMVIERMPLAWELCVLDSDAQIVVDKAFDNAFAYLMSIDGSERPNYDIVRQSYREALDVLDKYEAKV
jgi:hypothetical protein